MKSWINQASHTFVRKGGKTSRRARVNRLIRALEEIALHEPGVKMPHQIGRRHVHQFYARHSDWSERTLRDYAYAFGLLWEMLGRAGSPPKPPPLAKNSIQCQEILRQVS